MMNTYKPTPEKVAGWIKDHKYIQLAKTNTVEVWRAQKPGSSSYAFDLTMSRYGMAMYGDTGCLVWNVGKGYGLEFLASDDEDYVYNKLDHSSRETDLDEAYLVEIVYEAIIELLGERGLVLPEWKQAPVPMAERISELDDWLVRAAVKGVEGGEMAAGELSAIVVALRDCQRLEVKSTEAAYQWLGDHQELLELAADLDYTLSKPTNSVLQRIYLVRHAAQQILAQQKAAEEAAQQVQYCYSMGPADEQWSDDGLALYIIDRELAMGTVIQRGVVDRSQPIASFPMPMRCWNIWPSVLAMKIASFATDSRISPKSRKPSWRGYWNR